MESDFQVKKQCFNCASDKTLITKRGYPHWRHCNGQIYCHTCALKLFDNPKYCKNSNIRRICFKEKRIYLKECPRIGVCNFCRRVVKIDTSSTAMHHEEYDENDPTKFTIELCVRCHACVTWNFNPFEYTHIDDEPDEKLEMIMVQAHSS